MDIKTYIQQTRKIVGVGPNCRAFRAEKGIHHEEAPFLFLKSPESLTTEAIISLSPLLSEFICEVEMAVVTPSVEDHTFFNVVEQEMELVLNPGQYAIFSPSDIHRPWCSVNGSGFVRKALLKVPVSK